MLGRRTELVVGNQRKGDVEGAVSEEQKERMVQIEVEIAEKRSEFCPTHLVFVPTPADLGTIRPYPPGSFNSRSTSIEALNLLRRPR